MQRNEHKRLIRIIARVLVEAGASLQKITQTLSIRGRRAGQEREKETTTRDMRYIRFRRVCEN